MERKLSYGSLMMKRSMNIVLLTMVLVACRAWGADDLTVHKRQRVARGDGSFEVVQKPEKWIPAQTAIIASGRIAKPRAHSASSAAGSSRALR